VRLGSRACDLLLALLEKPGQVVSKQELLTRVWPDTFVEEAGLRVHVAALRRALGDGNAGRRFIANVPGRGYSFVAAVSVSSEETNVYASSPAKTDRQPHIPAPLARMVGRSDAVLMLAEQLSRNRFITIVGPGGIGKTTVALAVADRVFRNFTDGVHFVDFAPLTDPQLLPSALAARLGVAAHAENPLPGMIAFLKDKNILIVLYSCEHVIEAAATFVEEILNGTSRAHILATSREALRAEGEHVYRLSTLAYPSETG
jgi:DNA-binding winged helix-turn-helix (wHTH) protein